MFVKQVFYNKQESDNVLFCRRHGSSDTIMSCICLIIKAISIWVGLWRQLHYAIRYAFYNALHCGLVLVAMFALANNAKSQQWDDGLRWTVDLSSRVQHLTEDAPSQTGYFHSVGLDAIKVFSGGDRDLATLNLQLNLWCIDGLTRRPGLFDDDTDCQIVHKVSTLNFALSGDGKFNFLIGHPEVPFGLEVPVSTSQTIRRLTNPRDLGLKLDWGVGVNGTIAGVSYASTVSRGSGMEYKSRGDPWAFAGRVGSATDGESYLGAPGVGVSWFYGDILTRTGQISERWRLGLDGITYLGPLGFMGQLSAGKTDSMDTVNGLMEVNAISSGQAGVAYLQLQSFNQDFPTGWQDAQSAIIGARYTPDQHWALSFQIEWELTTFGDKVEQTIIDAQLRYRF
jgi:hypothetical protein